MNKRMLLLPCLLIPAMLLIIGYSFSWMTNRTELGPTSADTAHIATRLDFALNENAGIPGETIALTSTDNGLNQLTNLGTEDYLFKLSYTVHYPDNEPVEPFITGLTLADADDLQLIQGGVEYNSDSRTLTYYGRHTTGHDVLYLGELHATFDIVKNPCMGNSYIIEADVEACQATEAAAADILGIDAYMESGKYAPLFSKP